MYDYNQTTTNICIAPSLVSFRKSKYSFSMHPDKSINFETLYTTPHLVWYNDICFYGVNVNTKTSCDQRNDI